MDVAYLVESFSRMDKALGSIPNPVLYKLGMVAYLEVKQEEQKLKVYQVMIYWATRAMGGGRDTEREALPVKLYKWSLVSQYKHVES